MNTFTSREKIAGFALIAVLGVAWGCEETSEAKENFDSRIACEEYCDKKYSCNDEDPGEDVVDSCVSSCRDNIEDTCGNEHQEGANDKLAECNDKACGEFEACLIFEASPACFGFVD